MGREHDAFLVSLGADSKHFPGLAAGGGEAVPGGEESSGGEEVPGAPAPGAPIRLAPFAQRRQTADWMRLFDDFFNKHATGIHINGVDVNRTQFEQNYVWPGGTAVRTAIGVVHKLANEAHDDAMLYVPEGNKRNLILQKADYARAAADNAASALGKGNQYLNAYSLMINALNLGRDAAEDLSAYHASVIDSWNHWITGCEIVRDAGFTALTFLAVPAGASAGVVTLIFASGVVVVAADDWAEGKSVGEIAFNAFLAIFFRHLGNKLAAAWKPGLAAWLDRHMGAMFARMTNSAFFAKFGDYLLTHSEGDTLAAFRALLNKQSISSAQMERLVAMSRKFIAERHVADMIIGQNLDNLKAILGKLGPPFYQTVIARDPKKSVKDGCHDFYESLKIADWTKEQGITVTLEKMFEVAATHL